MPYSVSPTFLPLMIPRHPAPAALWFFITKLFFCIVTHVTVLKFILTTLVSDRFKIIVAVHCIFQLGQPTSYISIFYSNKRNSFKSRQHIHKMEITWAILGGGRVVRWCWVNFQCRGVLQLDYSRTRAYCTCSRCGWGLFGHFYSRLSFLFSFSLSLGDGPI